MKLLKKISFTLCLVMMIALSIQGSLQDFESSLNTFTHLDIDQDYDQDGDTESSHHSDLFKLPLVFGFPDQVITDLTFPHRQSIEQPSVFDFSSLMLSEYVRSLLRPPSALHS